MPCFRALVICVVLLLACGAHAQGTPAASSQPPAPLLKHWSGMRALQSIRTQLSFGTRALDTPGHAREIAYIMSSLAATHAVIRTQQWQYNAPDGTQHSLTNIIARFDPDNPHRMIVGTHYDSIRHAYRDATHPDAVMPGANNSASGVAVLLETARQLAAHPPAIGVDMVFFDGEEGAISQGEGDPHWSAIGSAYFAAHVKEHYPGALPAQGVILDMVCYKKLKLYPEPLSLQAAPKEVERFWDIGNALAPQIFLRTPTFPVLDDDNALTAAGIPSFLVIGFDYTPWYNTTQDTPDKCATASLAAVGRTLLAYVEEI